MPVVPVTLHDRPNPPFVPRPADAPTLVELEVVTDFSVQGRVLARITELLQSSMPTSLLSVQPTSSGKGANASAMAKVPNTLVVLIVPYAKLAQEARGQTGSVDPAKCQTTDCTPLPPTTSSL